METKTSNMLIRVSPDEKAAFQEAADLAGIPLSSWVRERLRGPAKTELSKAGLSVAFLKDKGKRQPKP